MTRLFDLFRRGLSSVAFCAAFMLAAMETVADDPAPSADTEETAEASGDDSPDAPAPDAAPEEEPKPEPNQADKLFAEAVSGLNSPHETKEALAEAIRNARRIFEQIGTLPEADARADQREQAAALYERMGLALLTYGNDEERKTLLPELVAQVVGGETIGGRDYSVMASLLEASAKIDPILAAQTMAQFKTAIEAKGDENADAAIAQLEGVMRRANLVGSQLELAGTTFDGDKFKIGDLKGKVVLVDFWATWCPPCRAEHPNMLTNYRKYKEKGFEIVGVSLDEDREALTEFLDESEGDWIILHDEEGKNPATEYYAIQGIPTMMLIDEQGVVISTEARGEELTRLLEERFGKVELPPEEKAEGEEGEKPATEN